MRRGSARRIGLLALIALGGAATGRADELVVPRGVPVVVDGVLEPELWSDAKHETTPAGLEVRVQHDGRDLFLAVASPRPGFASLCVERDDSVDVYHASAALGQVRYQRRRDGWTTRAREFVYALRNPSLTALARAERRRYLEEHGWVASTFAMGRQGGGSVQEFHLTGELPRALALAFRLEDGTVLGWPATVPAGDGCLDPVLVRGEVPERLAFEPGRWAALRLEGLEP